MAHTSVLASRLPLVLPTSPASIDDEADHAKPEEETTAGTQEEPILAIVTEAAEKRAVFAIEGQGKPILRKEAGPAKGMAANVNEPPGATAENETNGVDIMIALAEAAECAKAATAVDRGCDEAIEVAGDTNEADATPEAAEGSDPLVDEKTDSVVQLIKRAREAEDEGEDEGEETIQAVMAVEGDVDTVSEMAENDPEWVAEVGDVSTVSLEAARATMLADTKSVGDSVMETAEVGKNSTAGKAAADATAAATTTNATMVKDLLRSDDMIDAVGDNAPHEQQTTGIPDAVIEPTPDDAAVEKTDRGKLLRE